MSVFKRAGSPIWQIEFQHQGQRVRRSAETTIKKDAEALEARWKAELREAGIHGVIEELTLSEAFKRYYEARIEPTAKAGNASKTLAAIERITGDLGADTPLSALTTPKLTSWRDGLRRKPGKDGKPGQPLSPASKNRYRDTLMAMLRAAHEEWHALAKLPHLKSVKGAEQRTRFLTLEEEGKLLAAASPHLRDLLVFLLGTGARKSEAIELEWSRVDLERERSTVQFVNTKSKRARTVPLPSRASQLLRRLHREAEKREGGKAPRRRVFVWTKPGTDTPIPYDDPKKGFRAARVRAGLGPDVTMHVLRHTYASRLVSNGAALYEVSKLLGHSTIKMTERYAHLAPEHLERTVSLLDGGAADDQQS